MAPPLQLHQMSELGGPAAAAGGAPSLLRWASGPAVMLLTMALTAMLCNRIWPPATGSGGHGPTLFAMKASVRLVTNPAGATVYVDDEALSEKTPAAVRGAVGKKAKVRVVLDGFEPYEATVLFTSDERPPLNVTLFRKGQGPKQLKGQDPTLYDDRPGTKTRPDPDEDAVEDNSAGKATAQKDPGPDKAAKDPGPDKAAKDPGPDKAQKNPKGGDEDPDGDKGEGPDKVAAKDPPEPDAAVPATRPGRRRRDKPEPVAVAAPKSTKATLSVLVRPWAVVYVDNKKIKQTPLRDFALSPGKHTILLVNDAKGKREVVPLSAAAGENYPITRNWD